MWPEQAPLTHHHPCWQSCLYFNETAAPDERKHAPGWDSSSVVYKAQPAQGTHIDTLDISEGRRALFTRPVSLDQGSGYLPGRVGCSRSPTGLRLPTCLGSPALLLCLSPDSQLVCRPLESHPGLALAGGRGIRPGNWISERVEPLSSLAFGVNYLTSHVSSLP